MSARRSSYTSWRSERIPLFTCFTVRLPPGTATDILVAPPPGATMSSRPAAILCSAALLVARPATGQGTLDDYRRGASIERRLEGLTVGVVDAPSWIGTTHRFWYR